MSNRNPTIKPTIYVYISNSIKKPSRSYPKPLCSCPPELDRGTL